MKSNKASNVSASIPDVEDGETFFSESVEGSTRSGLLPKERLEGIKLEEEEIARYARHLSMPEVTLEGQKLLKASRVLCIGVGGLGSPVALYLAAAGVGTLGLVDFDVVDYSNLQRQVLFTTPDVGRKKLLSARDRIRDLNPHVCVQLHDTAFCPDNAMDIVRQYDLVIDGSDNFPTRYLSNDVCCFLKKPNVYGSVFRFEGQVSVFAPHFRGTGGGVDAKTCPCYRCLFPQPPSPEQVPSCAEGGVFGVLPGLVGMMQAIEAIKLIIGIGEPLLGRLLHVDASTMKFREFRLQADPNCPVCGQNPTITEPIDYDTFCASQPDRVRGKGGSEAEVQWISMSDFKAKYQSDPSLVVLDVREHYEHEAFHLPNARHIPLGELPSRLSELDSAREIVLYCKNGQRSSLAWRLLFQSGFRRIQNLTGGMDAWLSQLAGKT